MKTLKLKSKQTGVALAVGMILLLIISVIGITSMKSALLQEKMAAGLKNKSLADAAAMSQLVEVERWLFNYYAQGNGTTLGLGSPNMVEDKSIDDIHFRKTRELIDTGVSNVTGTGSGFSLVFGTSINEQFGGILAQEPRFMVIPLGFKNSSNAGSGSNSYLTATGEFNSASSGSSGGSTNSLFSKLLLYRIVSKATDTTGHMFSAFESVMSVRVR